MTIATENVGIAFALVAVAGASTGIGAAVVFFPSIVKLASRRVLAGSLGFSAGVMCYVSFIEIFQKSVKSFEDAVGDPGQAYAFATLTFFGGVGTMMLLNVVVSLLLGGHGHGHGHDYDHDHDHSHTYSHSSPPTINHHDAESSNHQDATMHHKTTRQDVDESAVELAYTPPCCAKDPVGQLDTFKKMASVLQHEQESEDGQDDDDDDLNENIKDDVDVVVDDNPLLSETHAHDCKDQMNPITGNDVEQTPMTGTENNKSTEEKKRLVKMGMSTALAIGLHNFPEGLATFVAALNDPKVGVVLAIAISIHNIPEGLCVALPIFYATGHRTKAFLWALLSGASEIVAAFLGWLILSNVFTDATYATLFGLVAGMMVIISIRELLPTAHFYDPEDTVVTYSFITGMVVMALSLVLFIL